MPEDQVTKDAKKSEKEYKHADKKAQNLVEREKKDLKASSKKNEKLKKSAKKSGEHKQQRNKLRMVAKMMKGGKSPEPLDLCYHGNRLLSFAPVP